MPPPADTAEELDLELALHRLLAARAATLLLGVEPASPTPPVPGPDPGDAGAETLPTAERWPLPQRNPSRR